MNIKQKRQENLKILIAKFGSIESLASATGTSPKHLSQINNGVRNMGDKVSEKVEKALGLSPGSLDEAPGSEAVAKAAYDYTSEEAVSLRKKLAQETAKMSGPEIKALLQMSKELKTLRQT